MNPYQLFLCLLLAYITLLISVGWYFNKRQQTQTDFWLAGKKAGVLSIGCSAAASWLSAVIATDMIQFFCLALCAVGLATAAMSCTDTFATSGASCISRDIFQRYLHPGAAMKQMLLVNRISVLIIIASATLGNRTILHLEAEARTDSLERVKQEFSHAYTEILTVVKG